MVGLTHDRIAGRGAIARILAFTPPILFGLIAATRVFPETEIAYSFHLISWMALAAFAALVLAKPAYAAAEKGCSIIVAMALANGAIMVFGGYHCWGLFDSVCGAPGHVQSLRALTDWSTVYANNDTYTYLVPFDGFSLRPPLYYLFSKIVLLFHVDSEKVLQEANDLIALGLQSPNDLGDNVIDKTRHLADAVSAQKYPSLLRLAQAQKVLLWASTIYFAIAAMRVVPAIFAAMALLALFDGGYLTHWYYIHAIESKTLYLTCFFATAAASLACMRAPGMRNLFLAALFGGAMVLARPQGYVAILLVAVCAVRVLAYRPWSFRKSAVSATAAIAIFTVMAAFPTMATFFRTGVVQPSNIYAMSRIMAALELATPRDLDLMPDEFTRKYLSLMLDMKARNEKPADLNASLHQNQEIAMVACGKEGRKELERATLFCSDAMNNVSAIVLRRHFDGYLNKIVLSNLKALVPYAIGGGISYFPIMVLVVLAAACLLALTSPWIALWGAAVAVAHYGLFVLLAIFAGAHPIYFYTSEPVFLVAAVVVLVSLRTRWADERRPADEAT
ncbi:MAG: hypothetical protein U1E81_22095 [Xanthobacteraceae bacterium]